MTDLEFLQWLHNRLVKVHGESRNISHIHKLRGIIRDYPKDKDSKPDSEYHEWEDK